MEVHIMQTTFKTRVSKGGDAITTVAIVDWNNVTEEQKNELAMRSVTIMQQAVYRTSGVIPAKDTIHVAELLKRERGAVKLDTPEARAAAFTRLVSKMTPAEMAALENQLRGKK